MVQYLVMTFRLIFMQMEFSNLHNKLLPSSHIFHRQLQDHLLFLEMHQQGLDACEF